MENEGRVILRLSMHKVRYHVLVGIYATGLLASLELRHKSRSIPALGLAALPHLPTIGTVGGLLAPSRVLSRYLPDLS